ncbi:MAG: diguanylate cyclase [Halovenus sp.]
MRSPRETVRRLTTENENEQLPIGLTLLSGAVAAAMVFPLTWLFVKASTVDIERARALMFRGETLDILLNSLLLMSLVTLFSILIGVPLAYLTVRTNLPFRRFWTILVALPLVVPSYIGAFAFVSAFGPRGEFQSLLAGFGIEPVPEIYGLEGAVFVITLYTYPYVYLTTRAALISFDERLIDAARTLNHGRWEAFRRVTLPQVRPAVAAGGLLAALYALSDFGTPAIMRFPVFTRQIYVENRSFSSDYAALLSLQLLAVVLVVLALEWRIRSNQTVSGDGSEGAESRIDLGWLRWPATALPAAVATVALVVPIWILTLWTQRAGDTYRTDLTFEWIQAFNSIGVSAAAAIIAGLCALPVAYLAANHDSPLALVMFDLDHFKAINDAHGHETGDEVLRALAGLVQANVRNADTVARWGGEEFMILLPETGLAAAGQLAEKLRECVEAHRFPEGIPVTASFGVGALYAGDTRKALLRRVDDALYRAKHGGRNRVVCQ